LPQTDPQSIFSPTFNPATIVGDSQSLRPITYFPGMLDHQPFKLLANQTFGYNDNVFLVPNGAPLPAGTTRGDSFSTTTVGAAASVPLGAQTFFANGTYGITRYAHDFSQNSNNYALNAGWDWVFTSRCAGRLVVSDSQVQAAQNLINTFTTNNIQTTAFNETAKCGIGDHVNAIVDSGVSRVTNSQALSMPNDANVDFIRGGLEYDFAELNTIGAKVTYTKNDYFNRSALATPGLATAVNLTEYAFYYRRLFSPKLEFNGTFGITDISATTPGISTANTSSPSWSAILRWLVTPKVSLVATTSQAVTVPQDIVADYQVTKTNSLAVFYMFSPKLSFNGAIGVQYINSPTVSGINQALVLENQRSGFASLGAIYQITPLLNATANYSYTNRKDENTGLVATSNVYLVGLQYQH